MGYKTKRHAVLTLAAARRKLERSWEEQHCPCTKVRHKFVKEKKMVWERQGINIIKARLKQAEKT